MAIKGTPTFPVRGIVQGVPSMGISWLVFKGVLAIVSNKETKYEVYKKNSTKNTPLEKDLSIKPRKLRCLPKESLR